MKKIGYVITCITVSLLMGCTSEQSSTSSVIHDSTQSSVIEDEPQSKETDIRVTEVGSLKITYDAMQITEDQLQGLENIKNADSGEIYIDGVLVKFDNTVVDGGIGQVDFESSDHGTLVVNGVSVTYEKISMNPSFGIETVKIGNLQVTYDSSLISKEDLMDIENIKASDSGKIHISGGYIKFDNQVMNGGIDQSAFEESDYGTLVIKGVEVEYVRLS